MGEATGDENGTPTPKKGRRGRKRKMQSRRDDDDDDEDNTGILHIKLVVHQVSKCAFHLQLIFLTMDGRTVLSDKCLSQG